MRRLLLCAAAGVLGLALAGAATAGDYGHYGKSRATYTPGHYDRDRGHYDYTPGHFDFSQRNRQIPAAGGYHRPAPLNGGRQGGHMPARVSHPTAPARHH